MSNTYDVGDLVRCAGAFTDSGGAAVDPTTVACKVKAPSGTVTTYVYGTDAALVKASTGNYRVDVDATAAGTWIYRFYSTGTGQAAGEERFYVRPSNIV